MRTAGCPPRPPGLRGRRCAWVYTRERWEGEPASLAAEGEAGSQQPPCAVPGFAGEGGPGRSRLARFRRPPPAASPATSAHAPRGVLTSARHARTHVVRRYVASPPSPRSPAPVTGEAAAGACGARGVSEGARGRAGPGGTVTAALLPQPTGGRELEGSAA